MQKGFAHLLLIIILLVGLVVGVYLVQQTQIFKPKASEFNPVSSTYALNELDDPPALTTYADPLGPLTALKNIGSDAGDGINFERKPDEATITIDTNVEPRDPKLVLQNMDVYYLRTMIWLLLDTHSQYPNPYDPYYVLCDILPPDQLAKIGAEPTVLKNMQWLGCNDPVDKDQFSSISSVHKSYTYKKILPERLVDLIESARMIREGMGLRINLGAKDFAEMIPFMGAFVQMRNSGIPGENPVESFMRATPNLAIRIFLDVVGLVAGSEVAPAVVTKIPQGVKFFKIVSGEYINVATKHLVGSALKSWVAPRIEVDIASMIIVYSGEKVLGKVATNEVSDGQKLLENYVQEALVRLEENREAIKVSVVYEPTPEPTQEPSDLLQL